jgi:hypothetical protein
MASEQDVDTSRSRVQTYVPAYQKSDWEEHADDLDMTLSEFVRSMVQAGRRGFTGTASARDSAESEEPRGRQESNANPQGRSLEERVLSTLSEDGCLDWDELVAAVTDDVETQLDEILQDLQARNEIRYSGREGGYVRR